MSVRDDENTLLVTAGRTGSYNDKIKQSLEASTATTGNVMDLWEDKFNIEAVADGQHNDRMLKYLQSLGATSNNLQQAYKQVIDLGISPSEPPSGGGTNPILDTDHPNLIAMYTMDNITGATLVDESPNGNDSTITGAVAATGKIGNALSFDGTNDKVVLESVGQVFTNTAGAVSAWVYTDDTGSAINTIYEYNTSNVDTQYLGAYVETDGTVKMHRERGSTSAQWSFGTVSRNAWHHFVFACDGSEYYCWVDGAPRSQSLVVGSDNDKVWFGTLSGPTRFSQAFIQRNTIGPLYYKQKQDQVRVFDRELTQEEITALYFEGIDQILATDHPNLQFMYTMDNISGSTIVDESPNAQNGTISGATTTTGKLDNALNFDGVNDYIDVGTTYVNNEGSISLWAARIGDFYEPLLSKGNSITATNNMALQYMDSGAVRFLVQASPSNAIIYTQNTWPVDPNAYNHIVLTCNGSTWKVYVNGVLQPLTAEQAGNTGWWFDNVSGGENVYIGRNNYTSGDFYAETKIDQIRLFDRELTADEVVSLYHEGEPPANIVNTDHPALLAMYTMDSIAGDVLADSSPNGNDGSLSGGNNLSTIASGINLGNALDHTAATGDTDSVTLPTLGLGTSWAISAWVNAPTPNTNQRPAFTNSWPNADSLPTNPNYRLGVITYSTLNANNLLVNCGLDNTWRDTGAPANSTWQHLVINYDGTTCTVWANGEQTLSFATTVSLDREGRIGTYHNADSGNFYFTGFNEQQRYFDRPLTDEEIQVLYSEGLA